MSSALDDIRSRADKYDWQRLCGDLREDIYLRGDRRVYVQYGKDGRVLAAPRLARGVSFELGSETTLEIARGPNYKTTVISWLAA